MHPSKMYLFALLSSMLSFPLSKAMDLTYIQDISASAPSGASVREITAEETALLKAAEGGNLVGCSFLLESGVPVNIKNAEGRTPLMLAVLNGHIKICELLINNGALTDTKDHDGHTALSLAADTEMVKLLELTIKQPRKLSGVESKAEQ